MSFSIILKRPPIQFFALHYSTATTTIYYDISKPLLELATQLLTVTHYQQRTNYISLIFKTTIGVTPVNFKLYVSIIAHKFNCHLFKINTQYINLVFKFDRPYVIQYGYMRTVLTVARLGFDRYRIFISNFGQLMCRGRQWLNITTVADEL